jgi:hypothetical protein
VERGEVKNMGETELYKFPENPNVWSQHFSATILEVGIFHDFVEMIGGHQDGNQSWASCSLQRRLGLLWIADHPTDVGYPLVN